MSIGEDYESLAIAMAMIDAAIEHLEETGKHDDAVSQLLDIRNDINDDRVELLGNGKKRPFHVSDLMN